MPSPDETLYICPGCNCNELLKDPEEGCDETTCPECGNTYPLEDCETVAEREESEADGVYYTDGFRSISYDALARALEALIAQGKKVEQLPERLHQALKDVKFIGS